MVEDSAIIAMDLECSLADMGIARVTTTSSAAKAMNILDEDRVDAALVDLFLGQDDGRVVASRLAELGIPFALMTGLGEGAGLEAQFPGVPILAKPFLTRDVAAVVERLF